MKKIFNLVKLNIKLFKKNLLIYFLQYLLILMMLNSAVPDFRLLYRSYNTFINSKLNKSIVYFNEIDAAEMFFVSMDKSDDYNKARERIISNNNSLEKLLSEIKSISSISPMINYYSLNYNGTNIGAEVVEPELIEIYKDDLIFRNTNNVDKNHVKAYLRYTERVSSMFSIGDVFKAKIYPEKDSKNAYEITLVVDGFINTNMKNRFIKGVSTGGNNSLDIIFDFSQSPPANIDLFIEYNDVLRSIEDKENFNGYHGVARIIYFDEKTSDDEIENVNSLILNSQIGNSNTSKLLKDYQLQKINKLFLIKVDKIFTFIIIIVSSLIILTYISSKKILNSNIIYKLNGASDKEILISSVITNLLPSIIIFLPMTIYSWIINSRYYSILTNNVYASGTQDIIYPNELLIIIFFITLLSIIITYISLLKIYKAKNIIKIIEG